MQQRVQIKSVDFGRSCLDENGGVGRKYYAYYIHFFFNGGIRVWSITPDERIPALESLEVGDWIFYDPDKDEISFCKRFREGDYK